jgi:hypothetical protein
MSSKKSTKDGEEKETGFLTSSQKKLRLPRAPGTVWFKDKSKYDRKKKHAKKVEESGGEGND